MQQIFHRCSLSLYLCWPARFSSPPRSLKSLINVPKVSISCSKQTKKPLWKAKYNSVSQSPNITVSPNLVVDNTTVENVVRQLWPSRHTCEANQQLKILPFQSPCTGTELRGQVTPWERQHTLQHDFQSFVLPEIAMIVAANTRHGNIPVIRVSGLRIENFHIFVWTQIFS